jgi:hypothetical protein
MNESIHGGKTASEPQDRVTELIEQQTAPHDMQPIFDAILDRRRGPRRSTLQPFARANGATLCDSR